MNTLKRIKASIVTSNSVSCIIDGKPYVMSSSHEAFNVFRDAVERGAADEALEAMQGGTVILNSLGGDIEVTETTVKYKGKDLNHVLVDKLIAYAKEGKEMANNVVNMLERLMKNPSQKSVNQLYPFLEHKHMPITEEGKIIGYKGVAEDYYSIHGGSATVIRGTVNNKGQILNAPGETIEIVRNNVCDDENVHCAQGIHIGSYEYADSWAGSNGKLMLVEFDPADAVSVPNDHNFQKLRVCKYKVLSEITERKPLDTPSKYSQIKMREIDIENLTSEEDCVRLAISRVRDESITIGKVVEEAANIKDNYGIFDEAGYNEAYEDFQDEHTDEEPEEDDFRDYDGSDFTASSVVSIIEDYLHDYYVDVDDDVARNQWTVLPING